MGTRDDTPDGVRQAGLGALVARTRGSPDVAVGLIDGPVWVAHPLLDATGLRPLDAASTCAAPATGAACAHGTFVAGILHARRGSAAPALCPGCPLVIQAIFGDRASPGALPRADPEALAEALHACLRAGVRVVNLSLAVERASAAATRAISAVLDDAARRGVLVVAAAGNQGSIGGTALTAHRAVLPVVALDRHGRVIDFSNLGPVIGRRGLAAPGDAVASLALPAGLHRQSGTSVAAPFVTGAAALLWSLAPDLDAGAIRRALVGRDAPRTSIVPPALHGDAALRALPMPARALPGRALPGRALPGRALPARAPRDARVPAR